MTNERALANQERAMQVKRLGRFAKASLMTVATLMTFATVSLLVADHLYRPDAFVIDQLKLTGKFTYLTPEDVQAVVHQEKLGNFFSIELAEIKQRLEDMAWVKHADVRREWPHTLSVRIREHRPVMRWHSVQPIAAAKSSKASKASKDNTSKDSASKDKTGEQWVSSAGEIISLETPLNRVSPITLTGTDYDAKRLLAKALAWQKRLSSSQIALLEVSLSPSQSWTLTLAKVGEGEPEAFELLLGRDNIDERLARFRALFDLHFSDGSRQLVRIDARYPDGLAVEEKDVKQEPEAVSDINTAEMPRDAADCFKCVNQTNGSAAYAT